MLKNINPNLVIIAILAVSMLMFTSKGFTLNNSAKAIGEFPPDQNIIVTDISLGKDVHGIAMIDTISQHIWIYEVSRSASARSRLRLIAARSWEYDRLLDQYNTADPTPEQVRKLVEKSISPDAEQIQEQESK